LEANRIAGLMRRFRQGQHDAAGELVEMFYPQLRRLAASRMRREMGPHTWQTTALVHELYLELVKVRALEASDGDEEEERAAFLKLSAHLMKRLLIHHSRPLARHSVKLEIDDHVMGTDSGEQMLQELDQLLDRLAGVDPVLREVVELRVFEGLTGDETAARLNCSPRSVVRYWTFARKWLESHMGASLSQ
jgi:RNA polymerase sigma factor (TIGR02999 family)